MQEVIWRHPDWTQSEAPMIPGSPATLRHSLGVRVAFVAISILCSITGNIGNSMLAANLPTVQGNLALTPVQGQWLLAAYTMTNCWSNLLVFKFRIQFGIGAFARLGLVTYAAVAVLSMFAQDFPTALIVRAAAGLAAAPLFALASLYMIQAAGAGNVPRGAMIGITLTQLSPPLAFILAPQMVDLARPGLQYMFEAGLALVALAATTILPLPYSQRVRVFERADAVTIALFAPGLALLVAVLAQARLQWWTDAPWLGLAAAGSLALLCAGAVFEARRAFPLLDVRWLGTPDLLRFAAGAVLIRLLTGEQTIGAVGFLRGVGMGPDQLSTLFAVVMVAALAGLAVVVFFGGPKTIVPLIGAAVLLIGISALLDRDATPQDRIQNFMVSQALIGLASTLFVGPLLLSGIVKSIRSGTNTVVTLIIVFGASQSIALQLGGAVLGTYQAVQQRGYATAFFSDIDPTNPIVQQRLNAQQHGLAGVIADPGLRTAQATAALRQSATLNANTRAYDDVFSVFALLAIGYFIWTAIVFGVGLRKRGAPV